MDYLKIYTDGSCSPNPGSGGWGFIALFPDCEIHSSGRNPQTTNNIMEMTAVIQALQTFPLRNKFTIYSDSRYVINCAQNLWKRKKNQKLWEEMDRLLEGKTIQWIWVKAHNGDHYNELVDKLAKGE